MLPIILLAAACNPTRYVPEGEVLLSKNVLVIGKSDKALPQDISKPAMKLYIKQLPNKRIFGSRFHLGLYNLSDIEKERWPHGWLRKIGEEPVIFDSLAATRSKDQLESYLGSKGYFNAVVDETAEIDKKEAEVFYRITPGTPYTIKDIKYEIEDSLLYSLVMIDTMNCTIERGMVYDVDLLQKERLRLERFIRDIGFYAFSTEDIFYRVDSSLTGRQVNVHYVVAQKTALDSLGKLVYTTHRMYRVRDIYVYPEFDPKEAMRGGEEYTNSFDTVYFKGVYFITPPGRQLVKTDVIKQS
ncbi:MAG TPA: POTRA domain-containing protein, partial [Bacteroidales bacterium]|nr:POTRA domain-containing protein [Bacteroidales bacterium]